MKTAILIVNLGTPDTYKKSDVRKYLTEFLNDPRVIDIPWLQRKLLVNMIIVPFRAGHSAGLYKEIWTEKGSPLMYHSVELKDLLQKKLGNNFHVALGMRYGNPSIQSALTELQKINPSEIIVLPLFPQYASATTGSVHEKVMDIVTGWETIPEMKFINNYCDDASFLNAWKERASAYNVNEYDYVLFSFHGLPERQIRKADPAGICLSDKECCNTVNERNYYCYRSQCFRTARGIATQLNISGNKYKVCFQSRLGKDPWIQPYTEEVLKEAAKEGKKRVLVFAPAFVSDCLETISEIGIEYNEKFREFGGEEVKLVESLNTHPAWITALQTMIMNECGS